MAPEIKIKRLTSFRKLQRCDLARLEDEPDFPRLLIGPDAKQSPGQFATS